MLLSCSTARRIFNPYFGIHYILKAEVVLGFSDFSALKVSAPLLRLPPKRFFPVFIGFNWLSSNEEIRRYILQVLVNPDQVHYDVERGDVRYFLRKVNDRFLCVITVATEAVTAYLMRERKYCRYKERRWR
ncbi:MAG: hypothetical protein NXY59_02735 [Aigarchaeota archaeon]|nr:hypothetical protein [Candidatus Pelearchaeum maunauluense]